MANLIFKVADNDSNAQFPTVDKDTFKTVTTVPDNQDEETTDEEDNASEILLSMNSNRLNIIHV